MDLRKPGNNCHEYHKRDCLSWGALSGALTDLLVAKGILERDEVGIVITNAMSRLNALGRSADVQDARNTLSAIALMHTGRNEQPAIQKAKAAKDCRSP